MSDAVNLVGVEAARDIYRLIQTKKRCLSDLHRELNGKQDKHAKQTISKYAGQMELVGVLTASWAHDNDGRWRRYYSKGNAEWARLFEDVIKFEDEQAAKEE